MRLISAKNRIMTRSTRSIPVCSCKCTREAGELMVDCCSCTGPQDLNDERCLRSVIRALASGAEVDSLVLSGNWDVSYGKECVRSLWTLAMVFRHCTELSMTPLRSQDCRGCPISPERFFGQVAERLPNVPAVDQLTTVQVRSAKHPRVCMECVDRTRSKLQEIASVMEDLGQDVVRSAFMVVRAEDGR